MSAHHAVLVSPPRHLLDALRAQEQRELALWLATPVTREKAAYRRLKRIRARIDAVLRPRELAAAARRIIRCERGLAGMQYALAALIAVPVILLAGPRIRDAIDATLSAVATGLGTGGSARLEAALALAAGAIIALAAGPLVLAAMPTLVEWVR